MRPNGKASSGSKSGGRKFGKVTQVDLEDAVPVEEEDGDSIEEAVTCLRMYDNSDLEEEFFCWWKPVCLMTLSVLLERTCI